MKKLTLATLSTLAFTLASTNVFAVDGTITVNGVVTDQTCTLQSDGRFESSGLKDITVNLRALPKSIFKPEVTMTWGVDLYLKNATGTGPCDAATTQAFKGIHLSVTSPDHLDATDKTILVNQATGAGGASAANPVFMRFITDDFRPVDFSASWESQAKSLPRNNGGNIFVQYLAAVFSKTGVVDAQNYTAKINYTIHYN
ncbi:type 1 fimbrial protein [Acinetobacter sp. NyZ410]|uniref:fimbrial protein n=1 Tax=Acinetobacter sp. NyZ410 TaxID=2929509 RepID=UPI001FBA8AAE|nr:type 1 fimbrial protein [Acinetobacter sp. NyZ410]UOH17287.1 type 1 fimbrial protein [Acinetobacter sp. NyZ410]